MLTLAIDKAWGQNLGYAIGETQSGLVGRAIALAKKFPAERFYI
jgi:hypothetical protein